MEAHLICHHSRFCGGLSACAPVLTKGIHEGAGMSSLFRISASLSTKTSAGTSYTFAMKTKHRESSYKSLRYDLAVRVPAQQTRDSDRLDTGSSNPDAGANTWRDKRLAFLAEGHTKAVRHPYPVASADSAGQHCLTRGKAGIQSCVGDCCADENLHSFHCHLFYCWLHGIVPAFT